MDILDDDAGVFAASRGNGVYLTTDNGSTWTQRIMVCLILMRSVWLDREIIYL